MKVCKFHPDYDGSVVLRGDCVACGVETTIELFNCRKPEAVPEAMPFRCASCESPVVLHLDQWSPRGGSEER